MFISRRFLQLGAYVACSPLLLHGCAAPAQTPRAAAPAAALASADSTPQRLRIGPAGPAAAAGSASTQPGEPYAARGPDGGLRPQVLAYARDLARERGLQESTVTAMLADARYSETVARLIAPAPGKTVSRSWITYRNRVVEPKRINWGATFWNENAAQLERAAQRFGVPASIIVAIIGVETLYGRDMGTFRVVDALTTLAFDYPDPSRPERAAMFLGQLGDFLTLSARGALDPQTRGSFAGAIGMPQFMPGSIARYAVDGDGDGVIDLTRSTADAIMSVGNFLVEHGWQRGLPVFAPVGLPADAAALVDGGLTPRQTWPHLRAAGARALDGGGAPWQSAPLGVIDLPESSAGTAQYRTATPNFFALTQYNRSYFYATAVADLAEALAARRNAVARRP